MHNVINNFDAFGRYDTYTDDNINWHLIGTGEFVYEDVGIMVDLIYRCMITFNPNIQNALIHSRVIIEFIITDNIDASLECVEDANVYIYASLGVIYGYTDGYREIKAYMLSDTFKRNIQQLVYKVDNGYAFYKWLSPTNNVIILERVEYDEELDY